MAASVSRINDIHSVKNIANRYNTDVVLYLCIVRDANKCCCIQSCPSTWYKACAPAVLPPTASTRSFLPWQFIVLCGNV